MGDAFGAEIERRKRLSVPKGPGLAQFDAIPAPFDVAREIRQGVVERAIDSEIAHLRGENEGSRESCQLPPQKSVPLCSTELAAGADTGNLSAGNALEDPFERLRVGTR